MSLLKKIKDAFKSKDTSQVYFQSDLVTDYSRASGRYEDPLIAYEYTSREVVHIREKWAQLDPLAKFITKQVAQVAFDEPFTFIDRETGENYEEMNNTVLPRLEELDLTTVLTQTAYYARVHGWAFILAYDTLTRGPQDMQSKLLTWENVKKLEAFAGERDVTVDKYYTSGPKFGRPERLKITVAPEGLEQPIDIYIHESRGLIVTPDPVDRTHKGASALDSVWSELIWYRQLTEGACWYGIKFGGKTTVFMPSEGEVLARDLDAKTKTEMASNLKYWSTKNALILPRRMTVEDHGGQGNTDYYNLAEMLLDRIAAGTGIPKEYLKGSTAGKLTGSEMNEKEFYKTISQVQDSFEPFIRELVNRLFPNNTWVYDFKWEAKQSLTALEEAELKLKEEQARQIMLAYRNRNEVRADAGLDPIEGGDEPHWDKPLANINIKSEEEKENAVQKSEGEREDKADATVTFLKRANEEYGLAFQKATDALQYAYAREGSVRKVCSKFQIGMPTFYKLKDAYQLVGDKLVGEALIAKEGVYEYPEHQLKKQFKSAKELAKIPKLTPVVPLIFDHVEPGEERATDWIGNAYLYYEDGLKAKCEFDAQRIPDWLKNILVKGEPIPVSAGFNHDYGGRGVFNGQPYDAEQINLMVKHIGVIVNPHLQARVKEAGLNKDAV